MKVPTYSVSICHPTLGWTTVAVAEGEQQAREFYEEWVGRSNQKHVVRLYNKTDQDMLQVLEEFLPQDWVEVGRAAAAFRRRAR